MVIACSYCHQGKIKFQICFQEETEVNNSSMELSLLRQQEKHTPGKVCECLERNGHHLFSCLRLTNGSHSDNLPSLGSYSVAGSRFIFFKI